MIGGGGAAVSALIGAGLSNRLVDELVVNLLDTLSGGGPSPSSAIRDKYWKSEKIDVIYQYTIIYIGITTQKIRITAEAEMCNMKDPTAV